MRNLHAYLEDIHPCSKFICVFIIAIFATVTDRLSVQIFLITEALLLLLLSYHGPWFRLFQGLLSLLMTHLLYGFSYLLSVSPKNQPFSPILWQFGHTMISQASLYLSISISLRLMTLIIYSFIFIHTTSISLFTKALVQQGKLPYKLVYGFRVTLMFLPSLYKELKLILIAQQLRGMSSARFLLRFSSIRRLMMVLLTKSIARSENLANAMDVRAFGAFPTRTYLTYLSFYLKDLLIPIFFVLFHLLLLFYLT